AGVLVRPQQLGAFLRPGLEQAGLLRDPVAVGAAPLRPVIGDRRGAKEQTNRQGPESFHPSASVGEVSRKGRDSLIPLHRSSTASFGRGGRGGRWRPRGGSRCCPASWCAGS